MSAINVTVKGPKLLHDACRAELERAQFGLVPATCSFCGNEVKVPDEAFSYNEIACSDCADCLADDGHPIGEHEDVYTARTIKVTFQGME